MEYGGMAAPYLTTIGPFSATGGPFSVAAGRISFTYGFKGPAVSPLLQSRPSRSYQVIGSCGDGLMEVFARTNTCETESHREA